MNLAELIFQLRNIGNSFTSYAGIETNVESVGDAELVDGVWKVKLKVKE